MSLVRFGQDGSDVYVYGSSDGWECCGCKLNASTWTYPDPRALVEHLLVHREQGHTVPEYVLEDLRTEAPRDDPPAGSGGDDVSKHTLHAEDETVECPCEGSWLRGKPLCQTLQANPAWRDCFGTGRVESQVERVIEVWASTDEDFNEGFLWRDLRTKSWLGLLYDTRKPALAAARAVLVDTEPQQ